MVGSPDLQLENLENVDSPIPECRIKDAHTGRELHRSMVLADRGSAAQRVKHQEMLDGSPPYDPQVLAQTGQGSITNLNWGDAENIVEYTKAGMIDLISSVERLVRVPIKRGVLEDEETKRNFEEILADEVTRTFRKWDGFDFSYLKLIHHWLCFGVGITYWEDAVDWRWRSTGLSDIRIPRDTEASEEKITIASATRRYELHELYAKIRNEEAAEKMGWNIQAVKQAMICASSSSYSRGSFSVAEWERVQRQFKNNDLGATAAGSGSSGRTQSVELIHIWVQEFDGTVSMYIVSDQPLYNDGKNDEWLYCRRSEFKEIRQAFNFFCYGIGTNTTYHSISGILRKIYPQVQTSNRLRSKMVDAAALSAGVMLQPLSETAYDRMNYVSLGPYTMLPPADVAQFVERPSPQLTQNVTPVLADMERTINSRAGQFQGPSPFGAQVEKTRFQVQAEIESLSRVGASQLNLFYPAWGRHLREATRRLIRKGYNALSPGGKEASEFRRRLEERGFPLELLDYVDIDMVTCERAVGAGSFAQRSAMLLELTELSGGYDEVGRHNLIRDRTAAACKSYEIADRYILRIAGDARPPMDKKIAEMENFQIMQGNEIRVYANEKHVVHLDVHIPYIADILQKVESGEMQLEQAVQPMMLIHQHCAQHLEQIQEDTTIQERVGMYRQALQQAGEIIWNGSKKLEAMQRKGMDSNGQPVEVQQQEQGGLDEEQQRKLIEFQTRLQMMKESSQVKMQIKIQEAAIKQRLAMQQAQQQASIKDAMAAAEVLKKSQQQ